MELRSPGYRVLGYVDAFLIVFFRSSRPGTSLHCCKTRHRPTFVAARADTASKQRRMGFKYFHRAPWCAHLQCANEVLRRFEEGCKSTAIARPASAKRPPLEAVGFQTAVDALLLFVCLSHLGDAVVTVLQAQFLLGHVFRASSRPSEPGPSQPSEYSRLTYMEKPVWQRSAREINAPFCTDRLDAHRRGKYRVLEHV